MTRKAVFIDMDNTLIETQVIYKKAARDLTAMIQSCGDFDAADINRILNERQLKLIETMRFDAAMLPLSYEQTLRHFVPDATETEISFVHNIARNVYATEAAVKEGVEDAIRLLAQHYDLYLVTVGDMNVQRARVDVLPFKDVFTGIFIVEEKETETYIDVLSKTGAVAHETVMIGDSLRSDIIPAHAAGLCVIHIPAENFAVREAHGHDLPQGRTEVKESFGDAVMHLLEKLGIAAPGNDNVEAPQKTRKKPKSPGL
jgi:putative hydrolase of the HAD superfamily